MRTDSEVFLKKEKLPKIIKYIIIPKLSTLGNTSSKVLKYIKQAAEEGRSLHIVDDSIILDNSYTDSMNLINALLQVDKNNM